MDESDFEGSIVLEKLAEKNLVDSFFEAIDSDNVGKAVSLMKKAGVDAQTISEVVKQIENA